MEKQPLTSRQREIYDYLISFTQELGYPPTVREICKATGLKSPRSASQHLQALERKGYIERGRDKSRAIRFLHNRPGTPHPAIPDNVVFLPLRGKVAAGFPTTASDARETAYAVDRALTTGGKTFMLKVEGKSMINAHIMEGDLIMVDPEPTASDGDVVVAMIGDETTVKKYETRNGDVFLTPANHGMDSMNLSSRSRDVKIIGKVVGLIRRMN